MATSSLAIVAATDGDAAGTPATDVAVSASAGVVPRAKAPSALKTKLDEMEAYVRDQLGDARSFSLDSPESRKPLLAALRN